MDLETVMRVSSVFFDFAGLFEHLPLFLTGERRKTTAFFKLEIVQG